VLAGDVVRVLSIRGLPRGVRFDRRSGALTGRPRVSGTFTATALVLNSQNQREFRQFTVQVAALPGFVEGLFEAVFDVSTVSGEKWIDRGGRVQLAVNAGGLLTGSLQLGNRRFPVRQQLEIAPTDLDRPFVTSFVFAPVPQDPSQNIQLVVNFAAGDFKATLSQANATPRPSIVGRQIPWSRFTSALGGRPVRQAVNLFVSGAGPSAPAFVLSLTARPTGQVVWNARSLPGTTGAYRMTGTALLGALGELDLVAAVRRTEGGFVSRLDLDPANGSINLRVDAKLTIWPSFAVPQGLQIHLSSQ